MSELEKLCEDRDIWGYDADFSVVGFLRAASSPRLFDMPMFAKWVDDAARKYDINQRILLAIAQKEQSFLTRPAGGPGWQRALDWTMGFGATDSGDIPRYRGTRTQIYSAAAGLRNYRRTGRTRSMVGRPLGESLPYIRDPETRRIVPRNEATAALYLYTPHASGARTFLRVWRWLKSVEAKMGRREDAQAAECGRERREDAGAAGGWTRPGGQPAVYDNGYPRPLRRSGRVDAGHVRYWFGRPCDASNLVAHRVPVLGRVYVHRRVAEAFEAVFSEIADAGLDDLIDRGDYGGTYCCRRVRGGRSFSPHSWGIAIDLNVHHLQGPGGEYRAGRTNWRCRPEQIPDSLRRLAPFFRRWGFSWGGDWKSFKDPMHFEATELTVKLLEGGSLPEEFVRACRGGRGGYAEGPVKVVLLPESQPVECRGRLEGDKVRCDLRALCEALGVKVFDHIPDQRKVYLLPPVRLPQGPKGLGRE